MFLADLSSDPYCNLAAEEFLLKEADKPVFRLWRNDPCVVVGRHQIIDLEVNRDVAARMGVPILRRLSGGGAVYHDQGNVNFTMISRLANMKGMDFDILTSPIVAALNLIGIPAQHGGRGDVILDGGKISGCAFYLWRGYVLHHGTMLFDADLSALESLLDLRADEKERPKSIRSVRSRVTNIKRACPGLFPDVESFQRAFGRSLATLLGEAAGDAHVFSQAEKDRIAEIARTMYRTPDWNEYGKMPA